MAKKSTLEPNYVSSVLDNIIGGVKNKSKGITSPAPPRSDYYEGADDDEALARKLSEYYKNLVGAQHKEEIYRFRQKVYLSDAAGTFDFFAPRFACENEAEEAADNEYYDALLTAFCDQDLGVSEIAVLSNSYGSCLRITFATDTPDEDFVYVFLGNDGVLLFGRNPEAPEISFAKGRGNIEFGQDLV